MQRLLPVRPFRAAVAAVILGSVLFLASSTYNAPLHTEHSSPSASTKYDWQGVRWPAEGDEWARPTYLVSGEFNSVALTSIQYASGRWNGSGAKVEIIAPSYTSNVQFDVHLKNSDGLNAVDVATLGLISTPNSNCGDYAACTIKYTFAGIIDESDIAVGDHIYPNNITNSHCPIFDDPPEDTYYLRTIVMHEFGHFLGFGDSGVSDSPMDDTIYLSECHNGISIDDKNGLKYAYGETGDPGVAAAAVGLALVGSVTSCPMESFPSSSIPTTRRSAASGKHSTRLRPVPLPRASSSRLTAFPPYTAASTLSSTATSRNMKISSLLREASTSRAAQRTAWSLIGELSVTLGI